MPISIVIPTYNRQHLVGKAIDSGLEWIKEIGDGEIIIVDDASTDETASLIRNQYQHQLTQGVVKLLAMPRNGGVTAAKNAGGLAAQKSWIIFLDSDDELQASAAPAALQVLEQQSQVPIVMFRCVDSQTGSLIGQPCQSETLVDFRRYLNNWTFGECLPVVRSDIFRSHPYDGDLRGFEGIAYLRMLKDHGPMIVSTVAARRYTTTGADRLSAPKVMASRARLLSRGHWRVLREFAPYFSAPKLVRQGAKSFVYLLKSLA
jgi:glycosyltransferase involved in cell wall biosynthesis